MGASELLRFMVEVGASDLHLRSGSPPFVRVDGQLEPCPYPPLSSRDTEMLVTELLPYDKASEFEDTHEADAGFSMAGVGRFRVNCFQQRGEVSLAIRRVRTDGPSFEELQLPTVVRSDGKGRVPAVEVLVNTGRVKARIEDPAATSSINEVIAEGEFYGMQTFDQALVKLVAAGLVTEQDARDAATNPHDFTLAMRGIELRTTTVSAG
jgi:Tfp pilus assembly pilus retraction ATPase PilT